MKIKNYTTHNDENEISTHEETLGFSSSSLRSELLLSLMLVSIEKGAYFFNTKCFNPFNLSSETLIVEVRYDGIKGIPLLSYSLILEELPSYQNCF